MTMEVHVTNEYGQLGLESPKILLHHTEYFTHEANFAMALLEKWGLVTAADGGEDSAGRAMFKVMPVEEVVARACDMASLAISEFRRREWTVTGPTISEAKRILQEQNKEREKR